MYIGLLRPVRRIDIMAIRVQNGSRLRVAYELRSCIHEKTLIDIYKFNIVLFHLFIRLSAS